MFATQTVYKAYCVFGMWNLIYLLILCCFRHNSDNYKFRIPNYELIIFPPVAQLDNAADSDSEERGFESLQAGQKSKYDTISVVLAFFRFVRNGRDLNQEGA